MSGSKTAVVLGISFAADLVGFVNFWDRCAIPRSRLGDCANGSES